MKRSQINRYIGHAKEFFSLNRFFLPEYAFWTPTQWKGRGQEVDEIRTRRLGWDVTDFGSGDFDRTGLLLFTLRNGLLGDARNRKTYAEKIMVVREQQVTPWHFHFIKTEDIINRGGGVLVCELYNSTPQGAVADTPVFVSCDGVLVEVPPGGRIELEPGESITMTSGLYHTFYGKKGAGTVMVGEVSTVNDDATDNRFREPLPRFPAIEEDEPPVHLLCNEYPPAK